MWPFGEEITNGFSSYPLWQIGLFELCHGTLSSFAALAVSLAALCLISITSRAGCSIFDIPSLSRSMGLTRWCRVVIYMALLSFSVGLLAHALEDLCFSWF